MRFLMILIGTVLAHIVWPALRDDEERCPLNETSAVRPCDNLRLWCCAAMDHPRKASYTEYTRYFTIAAVADPHRRAEPIERTKRHIEAWHRWSTG